jgi:hypothetical protein
MGADVYTADSGAVGQYDVGPGGALSPKAPASVASAPSPSGVAASPDGRSVYVTNLAGGSVSQYGVGPGGTLAPLPAPTVPTPADGQPWDIAVSPDSRRVYVSHGSASALSQFHVGVGGALTPDGAGDGAFDECGPGHRRPAARGARGCRLGRRERPAGRLRRLGLVFPRRLGRALRLGLRPAPTRSP